MIDLEAFFNKLQEEGVEFFTGVPDTLLNDFCTYLETHVKTDKHVITANEGNAIAIASGYHLSTGITPLVYMQNSGIGNTINPLVSLADNEVYGLPMVLLIGWRGDPSISDHAQHRKQGNITPELLKTLGIPFRILESDHSDAISEAAWAVQTARKNSFPSALIIKKGVLAKTEKSHQEPDQKDNKISREKAIECITNYLPEDTIYTASTGRITRELHAVRDLNNVSHQNDFLNVGAMGHTSSIACGLALGGAKQTVVCLDGDSAFLMHMGSITTAGMLKLKNYIHIVLNNGLHESVGGQKSAGHNCDFTKIAEASGLSTIGKPVSDKSSIENALKHLNSSEGPAFLDIHVKKGIRSDLPALNINHKKLKNDFMNYIKSCKNH